MGSYGAWGHMGHGVIWGMGSYGAWGHMGHGVIWGMGSYGAWGSTPIQILCARKKLVSRVQGILDCS